MKRRVAGLETEFGLVAVASDGSQALEPEDAARELFRPVVAWGRSSNVFLGNGGRLYLDVGSHPEYATAECDNSRDIVAQERAGEAELMELARIANEKYAAEGVDARIHLLKNNTDSAGHSFGSHENFMIERKGEFTRLPAILIPFLVTRQIVTGAGGVMDSDEGPVFGFSLRADHMWETVSSATTRTRPIINTRDEPHGDASKYRRLHVISGDSTMSELSTWMRFEMTSQVLRLIEAGKSVEGIDLADPIAAIRTVARDLSGTAPLALNNGSTTTAVKIQRSFLHALRMEFDDLNPLMVDLWERALRAIETHDFSLVSRELDWAIKYELFTTMAARHSLSLDSPQMTRLEFAYHDIDPGSSVFHALKRRGLAPSLVSASEVQQAREQGPTTTRAHLRSQVLRAAQEAGRDVTADWTTLRLNEQGARPITLLDPFATENSEVSALLATLNAHEEAPDAEWKGLP